MYVCVSDTGPETTFFIKIYNAIENFEVQREKRVQNSLGDATFASKERIPKEDSKMHLRVLQCHPKSKERRRSSFFAASQIQMNTLMCIAVPLSLLSIL